MRTSGASGPARRAVKRSRLFPLLFAVRERWLAVVSHLSSARDARTAALPFPLPPAHLRVLVHGSGGVDDFLALGAAAVEAINASLQEARSGLDAKRCILDFGCGCGRILRHLSRLGAEVHGVDVNPRLARWCDANLPFADCAVSHAEPPLLFARESFNLVYAISVFTHLPEEAQLRWIDELRRLLVPAGQLVLTTMGDSFRAELTGDERERFDRGELIVRHPGAAGRNACVVVHPPAYVRRTLGASLRLAAFRPRGLDRQDVYVFERSETTG